ncbi:MAG TPA: Arc family DNA-binding protein [Nakamurella sp.]
MPALHVRDVPESVVAAIRERATRHGRSMQQEIRQILANAAAEPVPGAPLEPVQLKTVRTGATSPWSREDIYGDAGR